MSRREARALRSTAARLEFSAAELREQADRLEGLAAEATVIKGRRIVEELAGLLDIGDRMHYGELSDLLASAGYTPSGVDPDASLLAALGRDERFEARPPRSGYYMRVA